MQEKQKKPSRSEEKEMLITMFNNVYLNLVRWELEYDVDMTAEREQLLKIRSSINEKK